uniref:Uncharacterized protein n=1 Tax=Rhizophora mucronata TaxID=61149 RepID=A0A2P2QIH5_RHIMU
MGKYREDSSNQRPEE